MSESAELTARFEGAIEAHRTAVIDYLGRDADAARDALRAVFADALAFDPLAGLATEYRVGDVYVERQFTKWVIHKPNSNGATVYYSNGYGWNLNSIRVSRYDTAAEAVAVAKGLANANDH